MIETDSRPVPLPTPCWWIDRGDCWEITHHPTRKDAEADHAERVRSDYGMVLSVAGAFDVVPGETCQEPRRCWQVTCPECYTITHSQERNVSCAGECGFVTVIEQIPVDNPAQARLFEVLPTHDIEGQPLSRVVMFTDESRDDWNRGAP